MLYISGQPSTHTMPVAHRAAPFCSGGYGARGARTIERPLPRIVVMACAMWCAIGVAALLVPIANEQICGLLVEMCALTWGDSALSF